MNGAAKGAIIGGVFLAMVGGTGYGVYALVGDAGQDEGGRRKADGAASVQAGKGSGPVTEKETAATAKAFLAAWAAGDASTAAELTNNTAAARTAVTDFRAKAHVSKAVITPGTPKGTSVPYKVEAEITYEGVTKPLAYDSQLTVVRGLTSGKPLVDWQESVLHPQLQKGEALRAGAPATPPVKAVDRAGQELSAEKYPSLGPVLEELRTTYGAKAGGNPGAEVWIEPAVGPRRTLLTLVEGEPSTLKTYLDAGVQAAAEQAVAKYP
ncbi:NTF2-like N-terminal transpeptidase domain-containing protein, partial [Streptomyces sp. NPDC057010]